MRKIFSLKSFWLVFLLSWGVIFVALLNFNRVFKSESQILIIPKGGSVANSGQIVGNIKEISQSLPFLNRMVEENPDVADEDVNEMLPEKKRAYWDKHLEIEKLGESGILKITGTHESRSQAEIIADQVPKSIIKTAGLFYNVQTDVDIRLIDGPVTRQSLAWPAWTLVPLSLALGFLIASFAFAVSFLTFREKKTDVPKMPQFMPWYRIHTKENDEKLVSAEPIEKKPIFQDESAWHIEKKKPVDKKPEATYHIKKAAAPDNLPVAPETLGQEASNEQISEKPAKEEPKEEEKAPIIREATPEEVKERLNKLLSGRF